jgi:hypothetical protein
MSASDLSSQLWTKLLLALLFKWTVGRKILGLAALSLPAKFGLVVLSLLAKLCLPTFALGLLSLAFYTFLHFI